MNQIQIVLAKIGGSNIKVQEPGQAVASLNDILKNVGTAIGVVILLIAIVKMILSFAEENAKEKKDASLLVGISIMFISISQVLTALGVENINGDTRVNMVAANIITFLGSLLTYAGAILALISIVMLIMAISQENADQHANGVKLLMTAIGLLSVSALTKYIKMKLLYDKAASGQDYINLAMGWVANVITYGGGGFALLGVFRIAMGLRTEDSKERDTGVRFLMVGIGLLSIRGVLAFFGISTGAMNAY